MLKFASAWPQRKLMGLNIDAGGIHARRVLERMVAAETLENPPS